jgi:predicted metalloprotease with PDZ domain
MRKVMRTILGGGVLATLAGGPALLLPPGATAQTPPAACSEDGRCVCVVVDRPEMSERVRVLALEAQQLARMSDTIRRRLAVELPRAQELRARALEQVELLAAVRPRLGVAVAEAEGRDDAARIMSVTPGSGAAEAGLREGDLVLAVNGVRLRGDADRTAPDALVAALRTGESGDTVRLTVEREGREEEVSVELRELGAWPRVLELRARDGGPGAVRMAPRAPGAPDAPRVRILESRMAPRAPLPGVSNLGVSATDLNEGLATYFGRSQGALVLDLRENAPDGLRAGDVITSIDGREVASAADLRRIAGSYRSGEVIRFTVWREGRSVEVEATLP